LKQAFTRCPTNRQPRPKRNRVRPHHCHRDRQSQRVPLGLHHHTSPDLGGFRQPSTGPFCVPIDIVILLDELGYLPFSTSGGALLFHLLSKLYERTSVVTPRSPHPSLPHPRNRQRQLSVQNQLRTETAKRKEKAAPLTPSRNSNHNHEAGQFSMELPGQFSVEIDNHVQTTRVEDLMLAALVNGFDGRNWLTITDQSDGDRRLIEVVPAASGGLHPEEIVYLTFDTRQGVSSVVAYAEAHINHLRAGCLDGEVTPIFLKEMPEDVIFTTTIRDDLLMPDSFGVNRVLGRRNVVARLGYERRGPIDSTQKAAWTEWILRVPLATVMALAGSVRSEVQPSYLSASLSQIKTYLRSLAAESPDLATTVKSLINEFEDPGKERSGIARFIRVLSMLTRLIELHRGGGLLNAAAADEFSFEAMACVRCFRQTRAAPLFHLSLSLLARILVTDPRLDAEKIKRGIAVSQYLFGIEDKMRSRADEAMLSFLVGTNRLAIVSATHDAIERSEWLMSSLQKQPITTARLLARMIRIRLGGSNAPDRSTWLEHLNRCDMINHMLDTSSGGAEDSSFPGAEPGKTHEGGISIDHLLEVFETCPPELQQLTAVSQHATENEYWGENRAPLLLLRIYATQGSIDAQSELLRFDYTEQRKLSRECISRIDYKRPRGLLLRSFRSLRRLWVENAFRPDDPEIWPLTSEPRLLTLESALARALGVKFIFTAIGGGYDLIGMARMNINPGSSPVEEGYWKESVHFMLDNSIVVLLQPDTTAGVEWEISEISRRGMIDRTIFIMLPLSVDASAADRWRNFKVLSHGPLADLPDYRPAGAFVFLQAPDGQFGELPFSAIFTGELSRLLEVKCAQVG
jgi:IstB-like ATP binding protein